MMGNDLHPSKIKINNIITHFICAYEDEERLKSNEIIIAKSFISATLKEKLFDEKRKIISQLPSPNNEALLQHAITELCEKKDMDSIKNFIDRSVNLDSSKYRIEIPYEDITAFIYSYKGEIFGEAVSERLDAFVGLLKNNSDPLLSHEISKVEKAYKKFSRHIKLAIAQRTFYLTHSRMASVLAEQAAAQSNVAKETATAAQTIAGDADSLAKKAQVLYDDMMVNYITILGIFASIIITVFGGINLANSTVKLLDSEFDLPMLVFVISILMVGFLSILIVLITWVSSLRKTSEYHSAVKWWILGGFSLLTLFSGLYLNHKIKINTDCQIGYYTCLHMDELKEPYLKNNTEREEN